MTEPWEKELEEALKKNVEFHGDDPSLALIVARWTDEQKAQARANIRACVEEMQKNM